MAHFEALREIICSERVIKLGDIFEGSIQEKGAFLHVNGSKGYLFPYKDCKRIDLIALYHEANQELLQRREEVKELMRRAKQAEVDENQAVSAADRLQNNVIQLTKEKRRLENEVDELCGGKKVVVSREVAEALGKALEHNNLQSLVKILDFAIYSRKEFNILRAFAGKDFESYISALVNGYTVEVEETLGEKINKRVKELLFGSQDEDDFAAMVSDFVIRLVKEAK